MENVVQDVNVAEATPVEESSSSEEVTQPEGESPAEGVKTEPAEGGEVSADGQPIPYTRFKEVNDRLKSREAELEEARAYFKDPEVLRVVMKKQGYTEDKITETLKNAGYPVAPQTPAEKSEEELFREASQGLDLSTQEGWMKLNWRLAQKAKEGEISQLRNELHHTKVYQRLNEEHKEASQLASEIFKMEYGKPQKDEMNPNTAIGKMWSYLSAHPEHAGLGPVALLRLTMSEEAHKLGEQQGIQKEKERVRSLKSAAMEGDAQISKDVGPDPNWPVAKLLEWSRTHNK